MQYSKKSVKDIDVKGKKVLVRCDFNVPQDGNGAITNDKRIREALPTIRYLLEQGAAVILCSHLGKPKGERKMKYTLTPVAKHLADMLGVPVKMSFDTVGKEATRLCGEIQPGEVVMLENLRFDAGEEAGSELFAEHLADMLGVPVKMSFDTVGKEATRLCGEIQPGEVVMLENLRFDAGEEAGSELFAEHLAGLADIYVNDAFGAAHRKHASTAMVSKYLPAVCGLLMEKEISVMGKAMAEPEHPFVAIMGGSKVSDKLGLIGSFVGKCDSILVVGGMAYTFFKAMGGTIGSSICDDKSLGLVKGIIEDAESKGTKIYLPVDTVIADQFSNDSNFMTVNAGEIPDDYMGMDIGPKTVEKYSEIIKRAKTIIWNGPAGVFEMPKFAHGTEGIARAVAESGAVSIIGGGDSAAAIEKLGLKDRVTHVSTGGGAAITFLEGAELPGVACLLDK